MGRSAAVWEGPLPPNGQGVDEKGRHGKNFMPSKSGGRAERGGFKPRACLRGQGRNLGKNSRQKRRAGQGLTSSRVEAGNFGTEH